MNTLKNIGMAFDWITNIFRPKRKVLTFAEKRNEWIAKGEWSEDDEYYYQEKLKREKSEVDYDQFVKIIEREKE